MPASPEAFRTLAIHIKAADGNRRLQDGLLDLWLEYRDLATEWDADRWGLKPDRWMLQERALMNQMPLDAERLKL
jgi:hypothetical protein